MFGASFLRFWWGVFVISESGESESTSLSCSVAFWSVLSRVLALFRFFRVNGWIMGGSSTMGTVGTGVSCAT